MIRYLKYLLLFLLFLPAMQAEAVMKQEILDSRFQTLKVSKDGDFMGYPVLHLGSDEKIIISFDEIGDERSYLRCRLVHCNADWEPSRLLDSEFADGFNIADIDDYAFSSNTFIHFVNYRIEIPTPDITPLKSGNYILQVFPEDDEENVLLQARFSVSENMTPVRGNVTTRTDRGYNDLYQQLELSLTLPSQDAVRDPFSDLMVEILQNGSEVRRSVLTHPQRVEGKNVIYSHSPELIFPAGNEYRRFETVRADYPGLGVDSTRYIDNMYHAYLHHDRNRSASGYQYDRTQAGRFLIREYNSSDGDIAGDYIMVHFSLDCPEFMEADIYLDGEFTSGNRDEKYRMRYDRESGLYRLDIPLKQGAYNYRYIAVPRNYPGHKGDPSPVEGDFHDTCNEYLIKIYQRTPGSRADRLIGDAVIYSYQ